jgi:hypothetical protein
MPVSQWTTIFAMAAIESLVFGAVFVAPLENGAKRWIAAVTLLITAGCIGWRFLR